MYAAQSPWRQGALAVGLHFVGTGALLRQEYASAATDEKGLSNMQIALAVGFFRCYPGLDAIWCCSCVHPLTVNVVVEVLLIWTIARAWWGCLSVCAICCWHDL
jgi:hypothetical protein